MKIAHIINVTEINEAKKASYLHVAQPVTIKSMVLAQEAARGEIDVELVAVKHKNEKINIPSSFKRAPDLENYAWEYIEELRNVHPRKPLPRIKDILLSLFSSSDAEYFIYSNVDISLYPSFYIKVKNLIKSGYDSFCINRKELPKVKEGTLLDEHNIELIFSLEGIDHGGIDCFVFRKEIVPSLILGNVFIGYPPIGLVLKTQIELNSMKFIWLKNERMTFHLGSDRAWKNDSELYWETNKNQASAISENCNN